MHTILHPTEKVQSRAQIQQRLRAFFEEHGEEFALTALGFFGSCARDEADSASDIDIVFETTQPNLWTTSIMKQDLEEWLQRPVDVIRLHKHLHPAFRKRLESEAIYV